MADQKQPDEMTCPTHKTPMVRHLEHTGDGASQWSKWYCPLCDDNAKRAGADATSKETAKVPPKASEQLSNGAVNSGAAPAAKS